MPPFRFSQRKFVAAVVGVCVTQVMFVLASVYASHYIYTTPANDGVWYQVVLRIHRFDQIDEIITLTLIVAAWLVSLLANFVGKVYLARKQRRSVIVPISIVTAPPFTGMVALEGNNETPTAELGVFGRRHLELVPSR